ncbi:MAG: hypothetical protein AAGA02_05225 [Bacteroidota bacterium]
MDHTFANKSFLFHFEITKDMKTISFVLILFLVMTYSSCGDDDGDTTAGRCPWNGNCSGLAPEGA